MKKYVIKNADGSWQHAMSAIHDTRKEAMLTLLRHITSVVEETNDDCIGDPFNYTIEEVDEKDVNAQQQRHVHAVRNTEEQVQRHLKVMHGAVRKGRLLS